MRRFSVFVFISAIVLAMPLEVAAKIFHSKESALRLAFPNTDQIKSKHIYLSEKQIKALSEATGRPPPSKIVTAYIGYQKGQITGYAFIDTHVVRTLPETFMTVVDPQGRVKAIHLLAFHEPPEYMPRQKWLAQFKARRVKPAFQLNREIAGIAGSTLSAHAVTRATRRILKIHELLFSNSKLAAKKQIPVAMQMSARDKP